MLFKEGKANWMRNMTLFIMLLIAQGLGALLGCAITAGGFSFEKHGDAKKITEGGYHVTQLCPSNGCNDGGDLIPKVLFCEAVCTFLFVSMVLMVVKHNGSEYMSVNALAIGLSLFLAIQMASGISGGCINPAVGLF
jgi:glycerol uptake facilitator-like aquaporin